MNVKAQQLRRKVLLRALVATFLAGTSLMGYAQGIVRSQQAYGVDRPLPFGAPPVASAPPISTTEPLSMTWEVRVSDVRLEMTLERWAAAAGYKLLWDADRHVLLSAGDTFRGEFLEAVNRVLQSPAISQSDYPLEAVVYSNNPPVLRITRDGDQSTKE